jgi:hypothetical protein
MFISSLSACESSSIDITRELELALVAPANLARIGSVLLSRGLEWVNDAITLPARCDALFCIDGMPFATLTDYTTNSTVMMRTPYNFFKGSYANDSPFAMSTGTKLPNIGGADDDLDLETFVKLFPVK